MAEYHRDGLLLPHCVYESAYLAPVGAVRMVLYLRQKATNQSFEQINTRRCLGRKARCRTPFYTTKAF